MPPSKTLRLAMIGSGFIAKAHSNAFRQVNHFFQTPYQLDLKLICSRTQSKLDAMAAQWGWAETCIDWRAAIDRLRHRRH